MSNLRKRLASMEKKSEDNWTGWKEDTFQIPKDAIRNDKPIEKGDAFRLSKEEYYKKYYVSDTNSK